MVFADPDDAVWAIGMKRSHTHSSHPSLWVGQNLLGHSLRSVRATLQTEPLEPMNSPKKGSDTHHCRSCQRDLQKK